MASNIISETIDDEYPVAGQANDSQGFRDNFNIIKTGLATANSEITDLQANAARVDQNNDFLGNQVTRAEFVNTSETVFDGGNIEAGVEVSYENGSYQTFTVNSTSLTLTLRDFPSSAFGKLTLELYGDNTPRVVTFSNPLGGIKTDENTVWSGTGITVTDSVTPVVLEFWSRNGGTVILAKYVGTFS